MSKDQAIGWTILLGSILGIVVYLYLVFLSPWTMLTIQISAFVAVAGILLILTWIGYTMATTLPPTPLEDLDLEDDFKLEDEPQPQGVTEDPASHE